MSRTRHRMWQSFISVVLAICLAFSMTVPAFAYPPKDGNDDGVINYVSLGDSMSNGYGLEGYNANTGTEDYGHESYANRFAEWLGEGTNHAQLAMSAMRAEDLHWLLEVDYDDPAVIGVINELQSAGWNEELWYSVFTNGDYYTWNELVNDYRFDIAAAYIENLEYSCVRNSTDMTPDEKNGIYGHYTDIQALEVVAKYYQESVANADIISLGIGNGNFGVFMFGRIMEAIGFDGDPEDAMIYDIENAIRECDPETQAQLRELMAEVEAILAEKGIVADDGDDSTVSSMEALYSTFMYATISFALNYAGSVEAILQVNPDAEIIQVALMNTVKSNTPIEGQITLGEVLDLLFKPLNVYIAALPTAMQAAGNSVYDEATFYFAEADYVECIVDTYDNEDGLNSIVRDRFYQSIVKNEDGEPGMVWDLLGDKVVGITLEEVETYESYDDADKVAYAAQGASKAMSISMYLAFENAIVAGKNNPVSIDSIMGLSGLFAEGSDPFGPIMEDFTAAAEVAGKAKYETVATALAQGNAGQAVLIMALLGDAEAIATVADGNETAIEEMTEDPVYGYAALQSRGALTGDEIKALCEAENWADAAYQVVADRSGEALTAEQVKALCESDDVKGKADADRQWVYIYEVAKAINGGSDEGQFENIRAFVAAAVENPENEEQEKIKAQVEGLAVAVNGAETIIAMQSELEEGVGTANGIVSGAKSLCTLLVMPEELGKSVAESELSGLLALFARCVIGNGIGSHPSADGHDALAKELIDTYENSYTAKDETIANLIEAAKVAKDLAAEYYDEAYAYAYGYAAENGYIGQAVDAIDGVIAELEAIDFVDAEMTDALKAEVAGEIEEIIEALEAAKALILEADVLDQDSLDALIAMLDEAGESIENLLSVLEQAGIDVNDLVVTPALEAAYDKLTNEVIPQVCADLQKAVVAGAEWLAAQLGQAYNDFIVAAKEAAVKYAPEAADAIYNYLLNNPEDVLAFLNEYGDDAVAFMGEYEQEIFLVLGYLAVNYGDDLVEFVLAHPEEILGTLVEWVDTHGENAWELVKAYADASGLTAAVQAEIDALEAQLEALRAQLESDLGALDAAAKAEIEKQIAVIEAQIAELEALLAELNEAFLSGKAEVEAILAEINAAYAELMAAVEALEAAAQALNADVKAAIAEVVAAAEALQAAIDAFVDQLPGEIQAAYDQLIAQLEALVAETASEAAQWLYDWLLNNPDKVIAFLNEYGDDVLAFVADHSDAILAVSEYLLENYGDDVLCYVLENADEILVAMVDLVEEYGDEAWELIKAYADASGLTAAVQAEIDALEAQLEALKAQLESDLGALDAEVKAEIEKQIALIEAQIAELEALLAELNAAIAEGKAEVEALLTEIQTAYDELMAAVQALQDMAKALNADIKATVAEIVATAEALQAAIDALVADAIAFGQTIEDLYKSIVGFVDDLYGDLMEQAQKAFAELDEQIADVFDAICAQIADALEQLGAETAEALKAALAKAEAELHALVAEALQAIIDGTFDSEALKSLIDGMYAALDELEAALEGVDAEIAAAIKAQIAQLKIQIALIENLVANYLAAAVEDATHGKYAITEMSRYAAIGDATILADGSYADQLAAKLAEIAAAEGASFDPATQYDKLVLVDENDGVATTADILAKIQSGDWDEAIANADLVTVSVGAEDLTVAVNNQLLGIVAAYANAAIAGQPYESIDSSDWASVVGEENAAYVDRIVEDIYAELLESIGDEGAAAMATDVVEAYAFAYVGFATSYAEVLNAIQSLSPEAQVVVVGLNNVFDGLVFAFGDDAIDVGEYAGYVVKAADLQFLAYAMLDEGDNVTFVSAPAADSAAVDLINQLIAAASAIDWANPLADMNALISASLLEQLSAPAGWMPNADGQAYILDRIVYEGEGDEGAMTITAEKPEPVKPEPGIFSITLPEGEGYVIETADGYDADAVTEGDDFKFSVIPAEGWEIVSVKAGGSELAAIDGVYTIENVSGDVEVIVDAQVKSYAVTVDETDNCVVTLFGVVDGKVKHGEAFSFVAAPSEGYELVGVTVNGEEVSAVNGVFTVENVTSAKTIKAEVKKVEAPVDFYHSVTVEEGEGYTVALFGLNADGKVERGGEFYFTVTLAEGYDLVKVLVNGKEAIATAGVVYTVSNVEADVVIAVEVEKAEEPEKVYYKVTLPAGKGFTATACKGYDASKVEAGAEFRFTVTAEEGYEIVSVKAGGKSLAPIKDGSYGFAVNGNTAVVVKAEKSDAELIRLWGADALKTMEQIVLEGSDRGTWSGKTVVLATMDGYWDALSATALAGLNGTPVLLTFPDALSDDAREAIVSLGATKVYIAGGPLAISQDVVSELRKMGLSTERLSGADAPETAVRIYEEGKGSWGKTAVVATYKSYHDALAVSPYAYANNAPVFLTHPFADDALADNALSAIKNGGFTRVVICGGTAAVPASVERQLAGMEVVRLQGPTAYETAVDIADWCIESEGMSDSVIGVATGHDYYDALTGASLCGSMNAPLVLVGHDNYEAVDLIESNASSLIRCYVFGGSAAVSNTYYKAIEGALRG